MAYDRRNRDLDPQLVWRGKDEQDWSDLVVHAPPLYIQEKVHPKVLIDDLLRQIARSSDARAAGAADSDLFADFNGMPEGADKTEFYQHDQNWSNRMILGDSLQVMASLAEREGLRGKVQCIYFDPPYGIKFNSNFQWSTTSRDVKDGNADHITREPEQVKAFRDTWRDGIHSYLTYLRDRLTVARDLLTESGSIFVQIGDENVHRVRALMDEVFGDENLCQLITFRRRPAARSRVNSGICTDYILWYAKNIDACKVSCSSIPRLGRDAGDTVYRYAKTSNVADRLTCEHDIRTIAETQVDIQIASIAQDFTVTATPEKLAFPVIRIQWRRHFAQPEGDRWKTNQAGMEGSVQRDRVCYRTNSLSYRQITSTISVLDDYQYLDRHCDTGGSDDKIYVVQTLTRLFERCLLMATDPGDLVLDPTCGSGTTAYVAEQWGRRWITIDTSRVALALARARIMGARYPYYLLADSREGQIKEAEVTRTAPSSQPVHGNIRHGFVYERVPHITLKSIANNAEIDVIWDKWQAKLEPLREQAERRAQEEMAGVGDSARGRGTNGRTRRRRLHADWWQARIARQKEIDASIAAKAEFEYLYDKPYDDKKKVRVAGPFTVESLSPAPHAGRG